MVVVAVVVVAVVVVAVAVVVEVPVADVVVLDTVVLDAVVLDTVVVVMVVDVAVVVVEDVNPAPMICGKQLRPNTITEAGGALSSWSGKSVNAKADIPSPCTRLLSSNMTKAPSA